MNMARKACPCCAVYPSDSYPFSLLQIAAVPAASSVFPIVIIQPSTEHFLRCWLPMRCFAATLTLLIERFQRPKALNISSFEANQVKRPCRPRITSRTSILCIRASKIFFDRFVARPPRISRVIFNGSLRASVTFHLPKHFKGFCCKI